MAFCTAINCMDGRVQQPVISYLKDRYNAEYVDSITEPGPNLILAEQNRPELIQSILERLQISVEKHGSAGIAVVGHYDCAGNPAPRDRQIGHVRDSIRFLRTHYTSIDIIGLWVNEEWEVEEI